MFRGIYSLSVSTACAAASNSSYAYSWGSCPNNQSGLGISSNFLSLFTASQSVLCQASRVSIPIFWAKVARAYLLTCQHESRKPRQRRGSQWGRTSVSHMSEERVELGLSLPAPSKQQPLQHLQQPVLLPDLMSAGTDVRNHPQASPFRV